MPFTEPYKQYFTKGDLVYGLAPERAGFMLKNWQAIMLEADNISTVDHYRPSTATDKLTQYEAAYQSKIAFYFPATDQALIDKETYARNRNINQALEFQKELSTFHTGMRKHPNYSRYIDMLEGSNFDEVAFDTPQNRIQSNSAFRAKSKFGMEWTIKKNQSKDPHSPNVFHIHFILNEIDMAAVVTKHHRYKDGNGKVLAQDSPKGKSVAGNAKERTITHSELRWIYRNSGNPLVQQSVQFWKDGEACCPPWENDKELFTIPTTGKVITWKAAWIVYKPSMSHDTFD